MIQALYLLMDKRVQGRHTLWKGDEISPKRKVRNINIDIWNVAGIIPNSFAHIFAHISEANEGVRFLVRVSYLEIYNEEIRDLLAKNQGVRLEVNKLHIYMTYLVN